jgi:hypothetical protein
MGSLLSTQTTAGAITVSDGLVDPFQVNRQIVSKRLDWEASHPAGGGHVNCRAVAHVDGNRPLPATVRATLWLSSSVHSEWIIHLLLAARLKAIALERQRVRKRDTYTGFPSCRRKRQPGCNAQVSTSFSLGPVIFTCSLARYSSRSLAPHTFLTLSRDSSVSIESSCPRGVPAGLRRSAGRPAI